MLTHAACPHDLPDDTPDVDRDALAAATCGNEPGLFDQHEAEAEMAELLAGRGVPRDRIEVFRYGAQHNPDMLVRIRARPTGQLAATNGRAGMHDADHMLLHYTADARAHEGLALAGYDLAGATFHIPPATSTPLDVHITPDADLPLVAALTVEHLIGLQDVADQPDS